MSKLNRETHFFKTARTVDSINQTVVLLWFVYPVVGSAITVNMQPQDSREEQLPHSFLSLSYSPGKVSEWQMSGLGSVLKHWERKQTLRRAEKKGADITSRTISHHRMPAPFCSVPFSHLHVNEYFSEEQSAMPMLTVMRSDNDKNV